MGSTAGDGPGETRDVEEVLISNVVVGRTSWLVNVHARRANERETMHSIWQDFHFSARSLLRHRGFTFAAVLSLGLGVGASSAVFALLDALFLQPLPFRQPEQLVAVKSRSEDGRKVVGLSYPDYLDYKEREDIFSGLLTYFRLPFSISVAGRVERVAGDIVSENYFTVLGLQMPLGRGFLPEEESGGRGEPVAVISYDLWQRALGGDLSAIQRNIEINGRSFSIVGVAPVVSKNTNALPSP